MEPTFTVLTDMTEKIVTPLIEEASRSGMTGFRRSRSAFCNRSLAPYMNCYLIFVLSSVSVHMSFSSIGMAIYQSFLSLEHMELHITLDVVYASFYIFRNSGMNIAMLFSSDDSRLNLECCVNVIKLPTGFLLICLVTCTVHIKIY